MWSIFNILSRSEFSVIFVVNILDEIVMQSVIIERILFIFYAV